jgi:hypothetical protein
VETVEVDRVRMSIPVPEHDLEPVPLPSPERRPRHLPVVGPRRVHNPRRHLDLHGLRRQLVLPDRPPIFLALFTPIEVSQEFTRIKAGNVHTPYGAVPTVGDFVLGRRLRTPVAVVFSVLPASPASVSSQKPARDPQDPRSPQKVPARDSLFLDLFHPHSSHPATNHPVILAKPNLFN